MSATGTEDDRNLPEAIFADRVVYALKREGHPEEVFERDYPLDGEAVTISDERRAVRRSVTDEPPEHEPQQQEPIDPRDIITLPDGTTGPIMDIAGLVDAGTDAPYVHEAFLGTIFGGA